MTNDQAIKAWFTSTRESTNNYGTSGHYASKAVYITSNLPVSSFNPSKISLRTASGPKLGKIPKIPRAMIVNWNADKGKAMNSNKAASPRAGRLQAAKPPAEEPQVVDDEDQRDITPMPSDSEDNGWLDKELEPKPVKRLVSRLNTRENMERVDRMRKKRKRKKLASKICKEQKMVDRAKRVTGKGKVVTKTSV